MAILPFDMRGAKLELPPPLRPVAIDFSPIKGIGEDIGAFRQQQQAGDIIKGATDASGNLDIGRAADELDRNGLTRYAETLRTAANKQQALAQAGEAAKETARHHGALEAAANAPTFGPVGEDQFSNKTYGFIDRQGRTVTPYGGAPAGAAGAPPQQPTITLRSGEVVTVPPGQDPKVFRQHVTGAEADAAGGKLTEVQSNALTYVNRMTNAEDAIGQFSASAAGPGGNFGRLAEKLPGGEYMMTEDYQRYARAKKDWISANLRKESGMAIGASEYAQDDKKFFPQPGDSPATIADKARARSIAVEGMKRAAGPGYKNLGAPVRVSSPDEARRLPKGTPIMLPDGTVGRVP
jgi:hypothetical protein